MVHTRHSYNKDLVDELDFHSHPESVKRSINDDAHEIENNNENDDDGGDDVEKQNNMEENENGHPDEEVTESKTRKRRRDINLYENISYYDGCHRRSLRNIERRNPYGHLSKSRKRNRVKGLHFGSSIIRRSDRQPKKVFETFNESEIQKTIERKHQEMLELEQASMYDSIKRRRGEISDTQDDSDDDNSEDEDDEEETEEEVESCGYSLRKRKPKTNIYQAPPLRSSHQRRRDIFTVQSPLHKVQYKRRIPQHGFSHPRHYKRRRRTSSTSSSDDEAAFERRKAKSMTQGRLRCLPMNFQADDITGVLKSREKAGVTFGSSLADVDPMTIDRKITFSEIGGLDHHIRALKEMVVFPLLYPEVFTKFSIAPPRGVLFYGPPGTGKTLVARALANECSSEGKKVAFFMRKGADCLSKWVGESERQLRLLFDQAYSMRPSIIFFDEIDGIAPVRSTRQDQIHSSIVSTLLALMDGLDARGEIVVIGATNRLDAIDPALRRPGRFDREFLFTLPNKTARHKILEIHTSAWSPKLSKDFLQELAEKCVGYCGADIKALCTEASLFALRRRYPQIYESDKKLVLDMNEIKIASIDFKEAMNIITPASHRSNISPSRALSEDLKPLLQIYIDNALKMLNGIFPPAQPNPGDFVKHHWDDESFGDIYEKPKSRQRSHSVSHSPTKFLNKYQTLDRCTVHRPRFLIVGDKGNGQSNYIAPALLYSMEHLTTYVLDLPALFGTTARAPEESVAQIFREARRTLPSIIYLPNIDVWWDCVQETTRATFTTLLQDMPSNMTVLFLATAEVAWNSLPENLKDLFSPMNDEVFTVTTPTSTDRYNYYKDLFLLHALREPVREHRRCRASSFVEVLPEAPPPQPRELSREESIKLIEYEESILRELRLHLRQATWKLLADRKFKEFSKPVDLEEVDDYLEVIKEPMDLSTVMTRINAHHYQSCAHYLRDIDLITNNCLEYNPDKDQYDRLLRNRACELRDVAHALVHNDLDPDFENLCEEIHESRKKRGYDEKTNAPSFLKVIPQAVHENVASSLTKPLPSMPNPVGTRYSRRVRGLSDQFDTTALEDVERAYRRNKTKGATNSTPAESTDCAGESNNTDKHEIDNRHAENIECTSNSMEYDDDGMPTCVAASRGDVVVSRGDVENKETEDKAVEQVKRSLDFPDQPITEASSLVEEAESLLSRLVNITNDSCLQTLERIYTSLCRCIIFHRKEPNRSEVFKELRNIVNIADCKQSCS